VDEKAMRELEPRKRWRPSPAAALPLGLAVVAAAVYAAVGLDRHNHFGSVAFDLGVQDQTVWGYSQLQMIPNTLDMIRNLLGDHFHPILMAVAPLYWIWNDVRVLLLVQAALLAAAGIPIFWWARRQLGLVAAVLFEVAYLIFWGIWSGVVFDFHHIAFAVPAVSFALYAVLTRNNRLLWAMLAVALLTRENIALTFAAIGVYLLLVQRRWQLGLVVIAVCSAWFALVVEVVMPAIAGAPYRHWTYDALGSGPGTALRNVVRHPLFALQLLFDNPIKLRLWGGLLGAWLFLPLFSPLFLVALPSVLERLWSSNPLLWTASFDYSMVIAPILAFAAIDSLQRIVRLIGSGLPRIAPALAGAALVLVGAILTFGIAQPLDDLRTDVSDQQAATIQSCLDVISPAASVSASNVLVPHLSHRHQIYLLAARTDTDYIAIDLAAELDEYPETAGTLRSTINTALSGGYGVDCSKGTTVVLHRGGSNTAMSPQLTSFLGGGAY
jgi:uncharacterized membrane protein